jgi:Holliday junction resolvasome RuvABC ATP-dependent DNA helicase subunit
MKTMKNDTDYFENIIGQDAAKKALRFRLENYNRSGILPHLLFNAPKGCGKTLLARTVGKALKGPDGSPKRFVEINCASVKNLKQFCETFLLQHVADKDVTVHLDEASELPKDVEMALLTILNPNDTDKTTFAYEDFLLDFDFRRQTFLFSTTEAHQMFGALKDRLKRVDLQVYSKQDLQGIIALNLKKAKIKFNNSVLPEIATVLRGNARQAVSMAKDIQSFMSGKSESFSVEHWKQMCDALEILPLGISPSELNLLRLISSRNGSTVTHLSAETGMTRSSLARDLEMFLLQNGLMEIRAPSLRHATVKGLRLLEQIDG